MDLDQKYPSVIDMQAAAIRRVPHFAHEYLTGGIGEETSVARNRAALNAVKLRPRYLTDVNKPDLGCHLLGRDYALPFGVAPIGLGGLMWPRAAEHLAASAKRAEIPFCLSTFATTSLEKAAEIAGEHAWFQLYVPNDEAMRNDIIDRAKRAGYQILVVTVDIPTHTRRRREIKSGLSVPPRFDLATLTQIMVRPAWAMESLRCGIPRFETLVPYIPAGGSLEQLSIFLSSIIEGHVTVERLKAIRDRWPGKLIVKGLLDPADVADCRSIGIDGIVVSNHGGRQLDAAPSPVEVLAEVRAAAGEEIAIIADSGVRSGLDVARMLALGADFVLLGRAFMFAVCAIGAAGGDHVIEVLRKELRSTLAQIGCPRLAELPKFFLQKDRAE